MTGSAAVPAEDLFDAERDVAPLLELRGQVWGGDHPHTDARFFAWLFEGTPPGAPAGIMLRHHGRPVGFAGLCRKRQHVGGREVGLAHGLDYMIQPGLPDVLAGRIALRVPQRWHQLAAALGFSSGVVFPNSNSIRILTSQRVGMRAVFQPDLLIRPLGSARLSQPIRGIPAPLLSAALRLAALPAWLRRGSYGRPRGELALIPHFDDGFDALWRATRDTLGAATVRDAAYLNWRFLSHPLYRYACLGWRQGGEWAGYAVCVERRLFGIDTLLLVDLLSRQPQSVGPALIDAAVDEAHRRRLGMVVTLAIPGSPLHETLRHLGFMAVPARFDPKRFTAAELVYDDAVRAELASAPRHFTWSDMDVV